MKLILYSWGSNSDDILKRGLVKLGHEVAVYEHKCKHYTRDLKLAQGLIELIHKTDAEAVISNDYFPIISMICNTAGILYYSWVYDSPHYTLLAKAVKYPCNRIGCFDRALVGRLNAMGIDTVRHLPLGVDWGEGYYNEEKTENGIDVSNGQMYKEGGKATETGKGILNDCASDISFVGSLYTGKFNYYDSLCNDEFLKDRADRIVEKQCFDYEHDYISLYFENCNEFPGNSNAYRDEVISDRDYENDKLLERVRIILASEELLPGDDYFEDIEYIFNSHFLEKQVTVEERRRLLTAVAGKGYDFALYTGSELGKMPELAAVNRGIVDYHTQMPKVFKSSCINLNITLRSIKSGIPLRALDIMGCGGFLMSNYQEELGEYFEEGREMVMFYSLEDCFEKIGYYLSHENERREIAAAGQKAVMEKLSYRRQLEKLLNWR